MDIFTKIAERRIQEALENGDFDDLVNAGKPLNLDDCRFIPEDLRMVYRILKSAGYYPSELELRNEIISLRSLVNTLNDKEERLNKLRELNFKLLIINEIRKKSINLENLLHY